jgi:DNA polymerase III gamma/tau subunit
LFHIKYRPSNLDEFVGNRGVIESLKNLLKTTSPHTYLFMGNSGCGKTTLSRIMARELGCQPIAIREINSADMRGIDFMRDLIKEARYSPLEGKSKAYILDEFHQVSNDAQNALLKILEDVPSHVYFFLCTTNPEKIITTIINRCHKFTVNPLLNKEIRWIIDNVIDREGLKISNEIKDLIVDSSEGVPRTALVLLSTLSGVNNIADANDMVYKELYDAEGIADLCKAIINRKIPWLELIDLIKNMEIKDFEKTRIAMLAYFIGCLKNAKHPKIRQEFTNLANICAVPLNYNTVKYEFFLLISQLYVGVA